MNTGSMSAKTACDVAVIGGGAAWIEALMRTLSLSEITVSDEDNLEGYAREKGLL